MENHNTHIVSEQSKEEHGYKYDNYGNVIVDSIDDLIYDKFVDVRQKPKESETKEFIKNIIKKDEFPPVTPNKEEKKDNSENEQEESEEKTDKRKSLININMLEDMKDEKYQNIKKNYNTKEKKSKSGKKNLNEKKNKNNSKEKKIKNNKTHSKNKYKNKKETK